MPNREITLPQGFDRRTQFVVGQFVAQLDLQHAQLAACAGDLAPAELEWQPAPGTNSIGMLLAHVAVAECYWLCVVPADIPLEPDGEELILRTVGLRMDDDGLPLPADGGHPAGLRGRTSADYLQMVGRARAAGLAQVRTWKDDELERTHSLRKRSASRHWILYHVLEHLSGHLGQVLLLRHLMVQAGVIPASSRP